MIVAELIAKLQEMPQDALVYTEHDVRGERGFESLDEVEFQTVEDYEYNPQGTVTQPYGRKEFEAVVLR